jgi:predicted methyltransferase
VKLTAKQRLCLAYVAKGWRPTMAATVESLARKHLVEHTSIGWRLTTQGEELIEKLRGESLDEARENTRSARR